jgi:copper chaperone CopZ
MKETVLNVKGMVCNGCENRVKNALKNIEGVSEVLADYNTGKVTITANEDVLESAMKDTIEDIGFEVV